MDARVLLNFTVVQVDFITSSCTSFNMPPVKDSSHCSSHKASTLQRTIELSASSESLLFISMSGCSNALLAADPPTHFQGLLCVLAPNSAVRHDRQLSAVKVGPERST